MNSDNANNDTYDEYTERRRTGSDAPQRVVDETQRARYEQAPPETSGQQSYEASGQSDNGGYSQPETGFGQRQTPGGFTQGPDGYNQGSYNQQGSYSDNQTNLPNQDGYRDTQGSGYGQGQNENSQSGDTNAPAQQGYDPTHSGVRHAQNEPGKSVDVPGRETGTAWGEDQQMGYTTDTSDRENPSR